MSDLMYIALATEMDLQPVANAQVEFRKHWQGFKNMPLDVEFTGSFDDVRALDYLDYESLGYPASDLEGAALVWGNVLVKQLGMAWVVNHRGDLLLTHDSPGDRITVWPYARVLEVQERNCPQFGKYAWLLERVIHDFLQYGDLSEDAIKWCQGVSDQLKEE